MTEAAGTPEHAKHLIYIKLVLKQEVGFLSNHDDTHVVLPGLPVLNDYHVLRISQSIFSFGR